MASLLELATVSAGYGESTVLEEISLSLGEGEIARLVRASICWRMVTDETSAPRRTMAKRIRCSKSPIRSPMLDLPVDDDDAHTVVKINRAVKTATRITGVRRAGLDR